MAGTHRNIFVALALISLVVTGVSPLASAAGDARLVLAREAPGATPEPGVVDIELDAKAYRQLWDSGRGVIEAFPLPDGQRVDLDLRPFQLITHDAVFINVGEDGEQVLPRPDIRFLRGTVAGDIDSLVVLSLFQNRISGSIRTRDEEFGVGPRDFALAGAGALDLQVWSRSVEQGSWSCGVSDEDAATAAPGLDPFDVDDDAPLVPQDHLGGAQLLEEMAVDSTTEWCAHFGDDPTAAQNYLLNAVAQISALYDSEISVLVQVPFLRTFCGAADPYTDGLTMLADRSQLLMEVAAEWSATMGGVSRTVTHLFSKSDEPGTVAGGLAYTVTCSGPDCQDVLCNTSSGYGVTLFPATGGTPATFEVQVASHELGHNHSSPHTNCLQDGGGNWLTECAVNTCGMNPWCQATGCFPGPANPAQTGTMMSTGCSSRVSAIDDNIVESILRGAADGATCVGAAGLPGESLGLQLSKVQSCPTETLQSGDNGTNSVLTGPVTWVKRFTPGCYPFQLTSMDVVIPAFGATVGRAIRIMVYTDPSGSGSPAGASLVYTEDTTVQLVDNFTFQTYTLASPVTLASGDFYIGFFDPVQDGATMIAQDDALNGDSYYGSSTDPTAFTPDTTFTFMIRGDGGPVPAGSLLMTWNLPCNDVTTPGQDFSVYRGDVGVPDVYTSLACTTNQTPSYFAEAPADGSFFLVVPHTSPSEGSYGKKNPPVERPAAAAACKPQSAEACP